MLIIYKRLLGRDLKNLCDETLFPHAVLETVVDEMILLIVSIRGIMQGGSWWTIFTCSYFYILFIGNQL